MSHYFFVVKKIQLCNFVWGQFKAITQPQAGTILLQGGAGSGKTTVGLHRIAYLTYQNPERFKPEKMLVVMFNRSLQRYISRALPELGVETGVLIETYHRWASKLFRVAGMQIFYNKETPPPKIAQFKRHSAMLALVDRYLEKLLKKSRNWFLEQLKQNNDPDFGKIAAILKPATQFEELFRILNSHPAFFYESQPDSRNKLRTRLLNRFHEHETDLHAVLSDLELLNEAPELSGFPGKNQLISLLGEWQSKLCDKKQTDFADTGILLLIMQRKGIHAACPDYAHIMVDEAQDLSEVELATLLGAADKEQSVTICGDMAQKIKGDVSFDNPEGFAGFIRDLQELANNSKVCVDTLMVGYRATRPIMELAWSVLDKKPSMAAPRDGKAVEIIRTQGHDETVQQTGNILKTYLENRPNALVGVVCRYKADADRIFDGLKHFGIANLRRHERDDFSFHPGVIVTNAHQVKGLEFSAVIIINPSKEQYRNDRESRMLLHVVISRASDRLWIIWHQPMAYGMEKKNSLP
ncbi:MAG: AAA family ATPase [Desulfobacterales bacterium]|nr:AAA family ATPase [Desulfobacterales bacterium]